jgi:hypothetical protein
LRTLAAAVADGSATAAASFGVLSDLRRFEQYRITSPVSLQNAVACERPDDPNLNALASDPPPLADHESRESPENRRTRALPETVLPEEFPMGRRDLAELDLCGDGELSFQAREKAERIREDSDAVEDAGNL